MALNRLSEQGKLEIKRGGGRHNSSRYYLKINPEQHSPNGIHRMANGESDSRNPERHDINPEPRSPDPSITVIDPSHEEEEQAACSDSRNGGQKPPDWKLFMDYWNLNVPFSIIRAMSEGRKKSFRARMSEPFFRENYEKGIMLISDTPFCCGENDRGWKANVDWFLRPDSLPKLLEGKYKSQQKQTNCL